MRPDFVTSFNDYANHIEKMSKDVKNSISKKKIQESYYQMIQK